MGQQAGVVGDDRFEADFLDGRGLFVFLGEHDLDDGGLVRDDLDIEDVLAGVPASRAVRKDDLVADAFGKVDGGEVGRGIGCHLKRLLVFCGEGCG